MDVFIYLVPLTLLIAGIGIAALVSGINKGHYDDCDRAMNKVLTLNERSGDDKDIKKPT